MSADFNPTQAMEEAEKQRKEVNLADARLRLVLIELDQARVRVDNAAAAVKAAIDCLKRARR